MVYLGGIDKPLLHPSFMEMVRISKERGHAVGISTKGYLLNDEMMSAFIDLGADLIYFSMDVIPMMPTVLGHAISEDTAEKLTRLRDMKNELKKVTRPMLVLKRLLQRKIIGTSLNWRSTRSSSRFRP